MSHNDISNAIFAETVELNTLQSFIDITRFERPSDGVVQTIMDRAQTELDLRKKSNDRQYALHYLNN